MKFNIQNSPFKIILILVAALAVTLLCSCSSPRHAVSESFSNDSTAFNQETSGHDQLGIISSAIKNRFLNLENIKIDFYPPYTLDSSPFALGSSPEESPRIRDEPANHDCGMSEANTTPCLSHNSRLSTHNSVKSISIGKITANDSTVCSTDLQLKSDSSSQLKTHNTQLKTQNSQLKTQNSGTVSMLRLFLILCLISGIYAGLHWYHKRK